MLFSWGAWSSCFKLSSFRQTCLITKKIKHHSEFLYMYVTDHPLIFTSQLTLYTHFYLNCRSLQQKLIIYYFLILFYYRNKNKNLPLIWKLFPKAFEQFLRVHQVWELYYGCVCAKAIHSNMTSDILQ